MIKNIEYCFKNNKIASFYFNKDDNQVHLTGFVHYFNEDEILISHITPRGEYDGYFFNRISNIYRLDYDGDYEIKIQHLYNFKKQSHPCIECDENGILFPLLNYAQNNDLIISCELQNDKITGLVNGYDNWIYISVIDDKGKENGVSILDIDEVITFSCDTDYEQDLKMLSEKTGDGSLSSN